MYFTFPSTAAAGWAHHHAKRHGHHGSRAAPQRRKAGARGLCARPRHGGPVPRRWLCPGSTLEPSPEPEQARDPAQTRCLRTDGSSTTASSAAAGARATEGAASAADSEQAVQRLMAAGRGKEGVGGPAPLPPAGLPALTVQTRPQNRPRVRRQRAASRPAPTSRGRVRPMRRPGDARSGRRAPPLPGLAGLGGGLDMAVAGPSADGEAAIGEAAIGCPRAGWGGRRRKPSPGSRERCTAGGGGQGEEGKAAGGGREGRVLPAAPPSGCRRRFHSPRRDPANPRARRGSASPLSSPCPSPAGAAAGGARGTGSGLRRRPMGARGWGGAAAGRVKRWGSRPRGGWRRRGPRSAGEYLRGGGRAAPWREPAAPVGCELPRPGRVTGTSCPAGAGPPR